MTQDPNSSGAPTPGADPPKHATPLLPVRTGVSIAFGCLLVVIVALALLAHELNALGISPAKVNERLVDSGRILVGTACAWIAISLALLRKRWQATEDRLNALLVGARGLAKGRLDLELQTPSERDVIGLLAHHFNEAIRRARRHHSRIEATNRNLRERNESLRAANEQLAQLSITDGLTKLHNHRHFQDLMTREIKRSSRNEEPLAMLLLDLDDFKALNDQHGHAAGDDILIRISVILSEQVRDTDLLARYGGEEFVVLSPNTDSDGAVVLAEKLRMAIEEATHIIDGSMRPIRCSVSIGVAQFDGDRRRFFRRADRALYRAKASGKNCVVAADPSIDDS